MDRKSLLSLFSSRFSRGATRDPVPPRPGPRRPDQVYQAAQAIRNRIDAALDASRRG